MTDEKAREIAEDVIDDLPTPVLRDLLRKAIQERDDAEARGEAMFEKLRPALTIAEAEVSRLQAALRDVWNALDTSQHDRAMGIIRVALSGKGET